MNKMEGNRRSRRKKPASSSEAIDVDIRVAVDSSELDQFRLLESQIEKVNGLRFSLAALAEVLENDARWVVPEQKSLEFHSWFLQ